MPFRSAPCTRVRPDHTPVRTCDLHTAQRAFARGREHGGDEARRQASVLRDARRIVAAGESRDFERQVVGPGGAVTAACIGGLHISGPPPSANPYVPSAHAAIKDAARRFAVPARASLTAASLRAFGFYGRRPDHPDALL